MDTSTILHNISSEKLSSLFESLQRQIEDIRKNFEPKLPTEYLTRSEVAKLFKCDLSTIHNWTKKGKLKAYGVGNRVYYKRTEIEDAITPL